MDKNIVLVGFMGTGKTVVGKSLAKKLHRDFLDTDELIEKETRMEIKDIFAKFSEEYFRNLESSVASRISKMKNKVISTGGGIVLREKNIKNLKKNGILIWLNAEPSIILKRVKGTDKRPLLSPLKENAIQEIESLLRRRFPYYQKADFMINTSNLRVNKIVEIILALIT